MNVFVPINDGYDIWKLNLIESSNDINGLDRLACGSSFAGCTIGMTKTIYITGNYGCLLWHELWHAYGHSEHYDYCVVCK